MQHHDDGPNVGEDDLHALIDGRLAPDRHRDVMGYLALHQEAADRVGIFMRQGVQLAALRERLGDAEPTRDMEDLARALGSRVHRHRRLRRVIGASAIGLAAAAAIAGVMVFPGAGRMEIAAVKVVPQAAAPQRDLIAEADLVGLAASDAPLLRLQAGMGGEMFAKPDLERVGLRFVGSSPLSTAAAPAVRLVYEDELRRPFHLFMGLQASGVGLAASFVPEGHIALSWLSGPLVFALIAPKDSPRLTEIISSTSQLVDPEPVAADATAEPAVAGGSADVTGGEAPVVTAPGAQADPAASKQL